jgi:hypothetical protein
MREGTNRIIVSPACDDGESCHPDFHRRVSQGGHDGGEGLFVTRFDEAAEGFRAPFWIF